MEVSQIAIVHGRPMLIFSCMPSELAAHRRALSPDCGTWAVPIGNLTGPYDLTAARPLTGSALYSGRIIQDTNGTDCLQQAPTDRFALASAAHPGAARTRA